jgi:hypothetical protein
MSRINSAQQLFRRERRPGDLVFASLFLAFVLFLAFHLTDQVTWQTKTKLVAQPAFWPTLSVLGMLVFAALHWLGAILSPRIQGRWSEVAIWLRALEFGGWFLAYVLILPHLGYLGSSLIFAVGLTWRLGYRSLAALGAAAMLALVTVVLFRGLLHVKIPAGSIYQCLPDTIRSFAQIYL